MFQYYKGGNMKSFTADFYPPTSPQFSVHFLGDQHIEKCRSLKNTNGNTLYALLHILSIHKNVSCSTSISAFKDPLPSMHYSSVQIYLNKI